MTEQREEFREEQVPVEVEGIPIKINTNETNRAIKNLKNRKASGAGGIKAELIKSGTPKLIRIITNLINRCIQEK